MAFSKNVFHLEGLPQRNPFWRELEDVGIITFRDNYQFELKSDFFIDPEAEETEFTQEFYLFIPETLQINPETYTRDQFYLDELNLIRYKTPLLTFAEMIDSENKDSPLYRIQTHDDKKVCLKEMILFGNIFRSHLRFCIRGILKNIRELNEKQCIAYLNEHVPKLLNEMTRAREAFTKTKIHMIDHTSDNFYIEQLGYVDEYISIACEEYLTLLLRFIKENISPVSIEAELLICHSLDQENHYREKENLHIEGDGKRESILYKQGLLEKFMIDPLKLKITRVEVKQQYGHLIGALAAGVAMLFYMVLFVWKASYLVINSAPFVIIAVILYILKDRIKEGMKMLYNIHVHHWFPDYRVNIYNPAGEIIGKLTESFLFIPHSKLPKEFFEIRMRDRADPLEQFQPDESIIQYKKDIKLFKSKNRLTELNTIFRFNIHSFLSKANDPLQPTLKFSSEKQTLEERLLPKVYHLHLILKTQYLDLMKRRCEEIKSFRIILTKNGLKKVEHLSSQVHHY